MLALCLVVLMVPRTVIGLAVYLVVMSAAYLVVCLEISRVVSKALMKVANLVEMMEPKLVSLSAGL